MFLHYPAPERKGRKYLQVYLRSFGLILFLFYFHVLPAQDLKRALSGDQKVRVNGGINFNQIFYGTFGMENRRDPYNYFLTGNLNIDLLGIMVPLHFNYSNIGADFVQPFNQFGFSPTYEWATLHVGFNAMTFSPYTLNGHHFLGAGLELYPDRNWDLSIMYGRFQRAVQVDSTDGQFIQPAYHRLGMGIKAGYGDGNNRINLIFFRSADDPESIDFVPPDSQITPEENMVWALEGFKAIGKRIIVNSEFAISGLSRDLRAPITQREGWQFFPRQSFLFDHRASTVYHQAFRAQAMYNGTFYTLGGGYERVDPGYRTHGSYFFNNDLENLTLNGGLRLMEQKLNFDGRIGIQKNDLNNESIDQMQRWVTSINFSFVPSEKVSVNGSYSNFQTYTFIRSRLDEIQEMTPFDNLDTLNFTQITQNVTMNLSWLISQSDHHQHRLNFNASAQQSADRQSQVQEHAGSMFYNVNMGYSTQFQERDLTLMLSANSNIQEMPGQSTFILGPLIGINKMLLDKKLRASISFNYNTVLNDGVQSSSLINGRLQGTYRMHPKHSVTASAVFLQRSHSSLHAQTSDFKEITARIMYNYNF